MSNDSKSLAALFQSQGKAIGLDDSASSMLIGNLNATVTPMCLGSPFDDDEAETDDFRLVLFLVDASGSMEPVADLVRETFNDVVIPGLLGGAKSQVGAIRYNGLKFSNDVSSLWTPSGWLPLKSNSPALSTKEYRANGSTALNKGVLDGITAATAYSLQVKAKTGTLPEVTIACISDGRNRVPPFSALPVRQAMDKLPRELFTLAFFGFDTGEVDDYGKPIDFHQVAAELGFRDIEEAKAQPGESREELRRRFRNKMGVFSSQLVTRVSSSRVGQSPSNNPGSGTGFFD